MVFSPEDHGSKKVGWENPVERFLAIQAYSSTKSNVVKKLLQPVYRLWLHVCSVWPVLSGLEVS
jgi:hypothetical protein